MNLDNIKWKEFQFLKIFEIVDGYYNKKPPLEKNGNIPFLGGTKFNNGITEFYSEETILKYDKIGKINKNLKDKRLYLGNCLAVTNNGSVGNVYYQENKFTCSHDVTILYLKEIELTKNIALFLIPLITKSGESFEYAKKWRPKRMRKSQLMLPIDTNGKPNWEFMELYIEKKFKTKKKLLLDYYQDHYNLSLVLKDLKLSDRNWEDFFIEEIGDIEGGRDIYSSDRISGETPYISSGSINNGIGDFIGNTNNSIEKNIISINRNGSVGHSFYHPYYALFSNDTRKIRLYKNTENIGLFITNQIMLQKDKYGYGYKLGTARLKKQKILLPVCLNSSEIDWNFIEEYIERIKQLKIKKYLEFNM